MPNFNKTRHLPWLRDVAVCLNCQINFDVIPEHGLCQECASHLEQPDLGEFRALKRVICGDPVSTEIFDSAVSARFLTEGIFREYLQRYVPRKLAKSQLLIGSEVRLELMKALGEMDSMLFNERFEEVLNARIEAPFEANVAIQEFGQLCILGIQSSYEQVDSAIAVIAELDLNQKNSVNHQIDKALQLVWAKSLSPESPEVQGFSLIVALAQKFEELEDWLLAAHNVSFTDVNKGVALCKFYDLEPELEDLAPVVGVNYLNDFIQTNGINSAEELIQKNLKVARIYYGSFLFFNRETEASSDSRHYRFVERLFYNEEPERYALLYWPGQRLLELLEPYGVELSVFMNRFYWLGKSIVRNHRTILETFAGLLITEEIDLIVRILCKPAGQFLSWVEEADGKLYLRETAKLIEPTYGFKGYKNPLQSPRNESAIIDNRARGFVQRGRNNPWQK